MRCESGATREQRPYDEITAVVFGYQGFPPSEDYRVLAEDLRLAKAAALYADHIHLVSPLASMLVTEAREISRHHRGDSKSEDSR